MGRRRAFCGERENNPNIPRIFKTSKRRRHETTFRASSLFAPRSGVEGKNAENERNASVDDRRHLRRMKKTSSKTRNWIGLVGRCHARGAVVTCAMGWSPFSNREKTTRTERKRRRDAKALARRKDEAMTRRMKRDELTRRRRRRRIRRRRRVSHVLDRELVPARREGVYARVFVPCTHGKRVRVDGLGVVRASDVRRVGSDGRG